MKIIIINNNNNKWARGSLLIFSLCSWLNFLGMYPGACHRWLLREEWWVEIKIIFWKIISHYSGLVLVGIIHTHPDFGPNPSTIDLHQLYEIQRDNSAAISIIVSPSKSDEICVSLTDKGMDRIGNCTSPSSNTFHRHKNMFSLYKRARNIVEYPTVTIIKDQR